MQRTVAVLGAGDAKAAMIARRLARGGHRVLVQDADRIALADVLLDVKSGSLNANVEIASSPREAAWEADIIVLAVPDAMHADVVREIRVVSTCKIVISMENRVLSLTALRDEPAVSAAEELARAMPHSHIVKAFNTVTTDDTVAAQECYIASDNDEAIAAVWELARDMGFTPRVAGRLDASRALEMMMSLLARLTKRYGAPDGGRSLHHAKSAGRSLHVA